MNSKTPTAFSWAEAQLRTLGTISTPAWSALPAEASHRRFFRATLDSPPASSWILMTAPPALEQNESFLRLARIFRRHDVHVPAIHAVDETNGWFLLEDLGTLHLADAYDGAGREAALEAGLAALLRLQTVDDPSIPPYTSERFADELGIFTTWFVEGLLAAQPPAVITDEVFGLLVDNNRRQPQCCVHRDWHCRNLLLRDDHSIGVVDFQDALMGPAAYDLASLLRDCYYAFDEAEVARWRNAWVERSPLPIDPAAFPRQFDLTAVQRQLKAVGIFARLRLRDGKATHLRWIEPVLDRLITLGAGIDELAPLTAWLRQLRPLAARRLAEWRTERAQT